jgi:hypothetical protein
MPSQFIKTDQYSVPSGFTQTQTSGGGSAYLDPQGNLYIRDANGLTLRNDLKGGQSQQQPVQQSVPIVPTQQTQQPVQSTQGMPSTFEFKVGNQTQTMKLGSDGNYHATSPQSYNSESIYTPGEAMAEWQKTQPVPKYDAYSSSNIPVSALNIQTNLGPGSSGDDVKKLQDWLVGQGFMTRAQVNTGYGTYGPQTKAAVASWQQSNGIDTQGNPGYFGPISKNFIAQQAMTQSYGGSTQEGAQGTTSTGLPTTGNPTLDTLQGGVYEYLQGLLDKGLTVNPQIELDPSQIQAFLDQAQTELSPYYTQQIAAIKDDLTRSLDNMQKQYDLQKKGAETSLKNSLRTTQENAAEKGTIFSGARGLAEQNLKTEQQRQLDLAQLQNESNAGNVVRTAERSIGSSNLSGTYLPSLTNYSVGANGEFVPSRTLNFSGTGGITGSLEREKLAAVKTRQNELELAARQSRALSLY